MLQTGDQGIDLDVEDLLTTPSDMLLGWDKRKGIDLSAQGPFSRFRQTEPNPAISVRLAAETRVLSPVSHQAFDVHVRHDQLWLHREALRDIQDRAVLADKAVTGEEQVGRTLAEPRGGIYVGGNATGGLLGNQRTDVVVLADQFIACR